ncbi:MAG: hypothetical protein ACFFDN_14135 [Candidatus Hodarchaeota archaeon]
MVKYHLKYQHIKKTTIQAVKDHWNKGFWKGDSLHKKTVFESLLKQLCEIYDINKIPQIIIKKDFHNSGMYIPPLNIIIMNKYSLITLLHEFKHLKDINEGKRFSEENAKGWSLSLVYQVNPNYLKQVVGKGLVKYITDNDIDGDIKVETNQQTCPFCLTTIRESSNYCYECGAEL